MLAVQLTLCAIVSACYAYDYNINDYCTGTQGSAQIKMGQKITLVANTTTATGTGIDCQFNFTMPSDQKGRIRFIFNSATVPKCQGTPYDVEINVYGKTIRGDLLRKVTCTAPNGGTTPVYTSGDNQDLVVQILRGNQTILTTYKFDAEITIYTGDTNDSKGLPSNSTDSLIPSYPDTGDTNDSKGLKSFSSSSCVLLLWAVAAVALASHH